MTVKYSRRKFLYDLAAMSGGFVMSGCGSGMFNLVRKRPNFVFFLVDDLGWRDLTSYGSKFYESPNIDGLMADSMRFTDAYAACPVCSPTRASILTGQYPPRVGITDWIPGRGDKGRKLKTPEDMDHMPLEEITFPEILKQAGYTTFFAGKWHLGGEGYLPEDQGFDYNIGGFFVGSPPGGYFSPYKNPKLPDGPKGEYLTDRLAAESVKFLTQKAATDNPFLLYLSFYTVHTPIQSKKDYIAKFKQKMGDKTGSVQDTFVPEHDSNTRIKQSNPAYAGMVKSLDDAVGRVIGKLKELDIYDDTIIIFMSDNGGLSTLAGKRRAPTSIVPLRAGKGWLYEGGIREPMCIRWPGITRPGSVCHEPVISIDFYPTILEMARLSLPSRQKVDGVSLVPLLKGGSKLRRQALYWHYPHYHGSGSTPASAIRVGDYKLIEFFEYDKIELYNLKNDLAEKHDLSGKMLGKKAELLKMLNQWRREIGAQLPWPNPQYKKKPT